MNQCMLLTSCYENSLNLAKEKVLKTIAFPLISAGVYGYPQRDAIRVAIETMKLHQDDFDEITLVLFGEREFGFAGEMFSVLHRQKQILACKNI
ncbi:MAG: macro domain-containing protein [Treponema sp.]|nr:macro domain-containing protein [Treponema sp.]